MTRRQQRHQAAATWLADHFVVYPPAAGAPESVKCRRCGKHLALRDRTGRRNLLGLKTHLSKHVGERLTAEGRA